MALFELIATLLFYALFLSAGILLRWLIRTSVSLERQQYLLDVVTTFSVLGCSLENSNVRKAYGTGGYFTIHFTLGMIHALTLYQTTANPCSNVVGYVRSRYRYWQATWLVTAQMLGALLSYQAARFYWSFELTPEQSSKYSTPCPSGLNVSTLVGFFIEFFATAFIVYSSLSKFVENKLIDITMKSFVNALLITNLVQYTGYFGNPMNASNQTFGCGGTSIPEHLLVYWIGPLIATVLTVRMTSADVDNHTDNQPLAADQPKSATAGNSRPHQD